MPQRIIDEQKKPMFNLEERIADWRRQVFAAAIVWLEWRSQRWPRYRRMIFGITAFSLNLFALAFISTMMVFAVISAANLLHQAR